MKHLVYAVAGIWCAVLFSCAYLATHGQLEMAKDILFGATMITFAAIGLMGL